MADPGVFYFFSCAPKEPQYRCVVGDGTEVKFLVVIRRYRKRIKSNQIKFVFSYLSQASNEMSDGRNLTRSWAHSAQWTTIGAARGCTATMPTRPVIGQTKCDLPARSCVPCSRELAV